MTTSLTDQVPPYAGVTGEDFANWEAVARQTAAELATTALERDRANRNPVAEVALLRTNGLLGFATPREFGGGGGSLAQALKLTRVIAAADGSIGQLLAYHYSNGVWTYILSTPEQWERIARGVGEQGWLQGSTTNPRDNDLEVVETGDGYRLTGHRTFATGVAVADLITLVGHGTFPFDAVITPDRDGLSFGEDWDNLGQRLTASGSVSFNGVAVYPEDILRGLEDYEGNPALRNALRGLFSHIIFLHFYLGIAEGAIAAAAAYIREHGRPWFEAAGESAVQDPFHQQLLGRHAAHIAAGIALADAVTLEYEEVLAKGAALTEEDWGRLAIRVDQAKAVASEVSLAAANDIFQATGARSTANKIGLDVYWRNLRTHTVHDPLPYRQREIGEYLLTGQLPRPKALFGGAIAAGADAEPQKARA